MDFSWLHTMHWLDWCMLGLFFLTLIAIGIYSTLRVRASGDYFVGGGKLPWWIGGISHHVGGYSAVVFTAWAMYAYRDGFSLYVWWALGFAVSCVLCGLFIAPKWSEVRQKFGVQSPTEYLAIRYGLSTQQIIVWSGVLLKLLDLAGKTVAMALILKGFAGVPLGYGVLVTGIVGLVYNTLGGFFASTRNDVFQFLVQLTGGILMFIYVFQALTQQQHGVNYFTMWDHEALAGHFSPLSTECNLLFAIGFWLAIFFGCSGGNWGAGLRFMAAPNGAQARRSAIFSGILYFIWPLVIFAPMWAAPIICPGLEQEEMSSVYTIMAHKMLPAGFVGIILASMFAASISTIAGDCNAVASVIARDIAPCFSRKILTNDGQTPLWFARTVALVFTSLTVLIAFYGDVFGGVVGLVVKWFSGLLGPISVPLILGLLPAFDRCRTMAANFSVLAGIAVFLCLEFGIYPAWNEPDGGWILAMKSATMGALLFYPVITSLAVFCAFLPFGKARSEQNS